MKLELERHEKLAKIEQERMAAMDRRDAASAASAASAAGPSVANSMRRGDAARQPAAQAVPQAASALAPPPLEPGGRSDGAPRAVSTHARDAVERADDSDDSVALQTGTVVRFNRQFGKGAINWQAGGCELSVLRSAIVSRPKQLRPGERVSFVVGRQENGRARALHVRSTEERASASGAPPM